MTMRWLVVLLMLAGCQFETKRTIGVPITQPAAAVAQADVDTARLRMEDQDVFQPSFRILDLPNGRTRLIVQDPNTHHYKVVGGW
jgi:hypothetical protein